MRAPDLDSVPPEFALLSGNVTRTIPSRAQRQTTHPNADRGAEFCDRIQQDACRLFARRAQALSHCARAHAFEKIAPRLQSRFRATFPSKECQPPTPYA